MGWRVVGRSVVGWSIESNGPERAPTTRTNQYVALLQGMVPSGTTRDQGCFEPPMPNPGCQLLTWGCSEAAPLLPSLIKRFPQTLGFDPGTTGAGAMYSDLSTDQGLPGDKGRGVGPPTPPPPSAPADLAGMDNLTVDS